jgi:predicted aldo/keto reductase-like oxidoreductase
VGTGGARDDKAALETIAGAWDSGPSFSETAAVYADGRSESLIGRFMTETGRHPVVPAEIPPNNYRWSAQAFVPGLGRVDETYRWILTYNPFLWFSRSP